MYFALAILRLHGCNRYQRNDILYAASAREIVDGLGKALTNGTNSLCTSEPLYQLIPYVARLQIGEYQYVRMACYSAARGL